MQGPRRNKATKLHQNAACNRELAIMDRFSTQKLAVVWDFAEDGGAVGTYESDTYLPANCVVTRVYTYEETAVAGATDVDFKAGSNDLCTAVDLTADTGFQSRTVATDYHASRSRLAVDINTAPATAGKVHFIVEFIKLAD